ncbi:MAG: hypothetical protein AAGF12_22510 [Myxococcota bacterium]
MTPRPSFYSASAERERFAAHLYERADQAYGRTFVLAYPNADQCDEAAIRLSLLRELASWVRFGSTWPEAIDEALLREELQQESLRPHWLIALAERGKR